MCCLRAAMITLQCIIVSYYWIEHSIDYYYSHCHDCPTMCYSSRIIKLRAKLIVVYFHRLKINHESHEFILESRTIANSYTRCCQGFTAFLSDKSNHCHVLILGQICPPFGAIFNILVLGRIKPLSDVTPNPIWAKILWSNIQLPHIQTDGLMVTSYHTIFVGRQSTYIARDWTNGWWPNLQ